MWLLPLICLLGCGGKKEENVPANAAAEAAEVRAPVELFWKLENREGAEFLVDLEGNEVPLKQYRRIVVLSPGAVETMYLIGGEASIAAVSSSRDPIWPGEKTVLLPDVGNAARPNLEQTLAAESDLVIGNGMNGAFVADLRSRGLKAIIHGANSVEDIFNSAVILGKLTGREKEALDLVTRKREELALLVREAAQRPLRLKGAFLYSVNPPMAFTEDSLAGEILDILGVENIAAGLPAAQPILSAEYILAQNPDFLFGAMSITRPEEILAADSVILKTRAGREGNIRIVPSWLFLRPSPRLFDGLMELREGITEFETKTAGALQ
jgi:iron complex transport system substrate-binding protein